MPDDVNLEKAQLRELDATLANEINRPKWLTVQFNPETLKVSFANQTETPNSPGDKSGTPSRQFVGAGTTKLSLQLWFDITAPLPSGQPEVNDVRELTQKVAYFITPKSNGANPPQLIPPAVRFLWGSFQFDGIMDSLDESIELFSPQGRPLRASMSLNLSQQKITAFVIRDVGSPFGDAPAPGTSPLAIASAGASLQGMADLHGGASWQAIASANGIENPRHLQPGQLIDMNVSGPTASVRLG